MTSIRVVANIEAIPEKIEELRVVLSEMEIESRTHTGCIEYEVFQNMDKPELFYVVEKWETRKNVEDHLALPAMKAIFAKMGGLLASSPAVNFMSKI